MQNVKCLTSSSLKRRIVIESQLSDERDKEENSDKSVPNLEIFYRTTWYTYKMTPLYKFNTTRHDLLNYSRRLTATLHAQLAKNVGVMIGNNVNNEVKATFALLDGFVQCYTDTAILITVTTTDKMLFRGLLCSIGMSTTLEFRKEHADFATLPLFLNNGSETIRNIVQEYLKTNFNCFISRLTFPTAELAWMATMWACSEDNHLPLHLGYLLPVKELTAIKYEISRESVEPIWKFVKGSSNNLTEEKVNQFMELLEKHFSYICRINSSTFQLSEIGTPAAFVHKDGKLKILSQIAIYKVLSHLNNLCEEILFSRQD